MLSTSPCYVVRSFLEFDASMRLARWPALCRPVVGTLRLRRCLAARRVVMRALLRLRLFSPEVELQAMDFHGVKPSFVSESFGPAGILATASCQAAVGSARLVCQGLGCAPSVAEPSDIKSSNM